MGRRSKIVEVEEVSASPVVGRELDFEGAVEAFLKEQRIRHRSARTIEWHRENLHTLKVFFERQGLPTTPRSITTKTLKENYVLHMLETLKLSPVTVNRRIRTTKAFLGYLADEALISRDPAGTLQPLKTRKTIVEAFTSDQVKALLNAPDRSTFAGLRDYTIMLLLLETGMRVSELASLRMPNIRWAEGGILVLGKGDKERLVPFQRQMAKVLRRYINVRGDLDGEDHVFITVDNIPLSKRNIQERIQDHGKAAKVVGVRVSPHTFRHTFAKMYIKNGGDAFSLQAILGHTTLEMVRHYVNLFSSDVQEQHRKFSPLERLSL